MNPKKAYEYAKINGPEKNTRNIACQDPFFAYLYAKNVDKKPRKDTRNAACKNLKYAYYYA